MKKVLPFILITAVILEVFFGVFGTKQATANTWCTKPGYPDSAQYSYTDTCPEGWVVSEEMNKKMAGTVKTAKESSENGSCNPLNWDTINCVLSAGALIAEYAIWMPVNLFAAIGGWAMDTSISLTVTGSIFSGLANEKNGVVSVGWGLSRDIVNIFLIFILLYIAIATILQLSGYGAKQLLITLIVIAFLVNFSGVITKLIIDASNILAIEFYNSFPQENGQIKISKAFRNAFNMEKIITADFKKVLEEAKTPKRDIYTITFLTYLLGAGILAIAGFIFIVFAVLFLIRMVVLLILLILAPLAFGAMILSGTKSYAKKWWDTLFHQAFFAPAALFMLWISAKMATSSFIKEIFTIPQAGIANMIADAQTKSMNWDSIAKFVVQFIIIAIMLFASIIVAKQMGAIGADAVQRGVTKAGKKVQGYAGKIGKKYGTMAVGRASEGLLKAGAGRLPVVGRGLAKLSGMEAERRKKQVEGYKKGLRNYSDAGLTALENDPTIYGAKKEALKEVTAERKAKTAKEEKVKVRKAEKVKEDTKLNELISQRKSELSRERESGVPDIQKIWDVEKEIMKLENTKKEREKAELTEELLESVEEMKKGLVEVKEKVEVKTKTKTETAKKIEPPSTT